MAIHLDKSRELQRRAEQLIPGGVNSPVRAFKAVGGDPPFLVRGEGAYVWDADGLIATLIMSARGGRSSWGMPRRR